MATAMTTYVTIISVLRDQMSARWPTVSRAAIVAYNAQVEADDAKRGAADIGQADGAAAAFSEPVREDDLVDDGSRQKVAEHPDAPAGVVLMRAVAHAREPLEGGEDEARARHDQPARTE